MQQKRALLLAVLAPLAVWGLLYPGYLAGGNGLSADSASYVECAKSIRAGRGFEVRPFGGLEPRLWQPLDLFPPGYSLLTAGLMGLGVQDAYGAARAVAAGCSFLFLLLVLGFYARTLPPWIAALLGIGLVATPPMLHYESMCLSEAPYMLLATASLLMLLKGTAVYPRLTAAAEPWLAACIGAGPTCRRPLNGWYIFAAGLAGGFAWCVRNVGVALFLASLIYLASQLPRLRIGGLMRGVSVWLVGWFLGCGWLVAWNLRTFGSPSPYRMPPRELPAVLTALIAAVAVAAVAAWFVVPALAGRRARGTEEVFGVTSCQREHSYSENLLRPRLDVCLLGAFLLFHVLAVIMAHCFYRLGESVQSFRFYTPVYWIGLWLAALYGQRLGGRAARPLLVAAAAVFAASQLVAPLLEGVWGRVRGTSASTASRDAPGREEVARLGRQIPKNKLVLADCVEELRVFGDINARRMPDMKYGQAPLTWADIRQAGRDGRLWGIAVWNEASFAEGRFGDALRALVVSPARYPQLRKLETGGRMSVWEFVPQRTRHAPREETPSRGA